MNPRRSTTICHQSRTLVQWIPITSSLATNISRSLELLVFNVVLLLRQRPLRTQQDGLGS